MCASTLPSACDKNEISHNAELIKCAKYSTALLSMNLQSMIAVLTQAMRMQSAGSMQGQMPSKGNIACSKLVLQSRGYLSCVLPVPVVSQPLRLQAFSRHCFELLLQRLKCCLSGACALTAFSLLMVCVTTGLFRIWCQAQRRGC